MSLITQDEIIDIVQVDDHFSVNNITDEQIRTFELILANRFLGEEFYKKLEADKVGTGTFNTIANQVLYDDYLKVLLSYFIVLNTFEMSVHNLDNAGLENTGSSNTETTYKTKLNISNRYKQSKDLTESYLSNDENKGVFISFLGNGYVTQTSKSTKPKMFGGFLINNYE